MHGNDLNIRRPVLLPGDHTRLAFVPAALLLVDHRVTITIADPAVREFVPHRRFSVAVLGSFVDALLVRVVVAVLALESLFEEALEELLAVLADGRSGVGVQDEGVRDVDAARDGAGRAGGDGGRTETALELKEGNDFEFMKEDK